MTRKKEGNLLGCHPIVLFSCWEAAVFCSLGKTGNSSGTSLFLGVGPELGKVVYFYQVKWSCIHIFFRSNRIPILKILHIPDGVVLADIKRGKPRGAGVWAGSRRGSWIRKMQCDIQTPKRNDLSRVGVLSQRQHLTAISRPYSKICTKNSYSGYQAYNKISLLLILDAQGKTNEW